ncbi:MAG: hypothetical protein P1U34_06230 [Coxiellaceae bacterium]|nr:hypothetical protein [Coxiellaceae bacterium]
MTQLTYAVEKMARNHADPDDVSRYRVIELQYDGIATGRQATYLSEHKPVLNEEGRERLKGRLVGMHELAIGAEPSKTQMRRPRYAPRYGATAIIKKLTHVSGDETFPHHLALKCFVSEPGEEALSGDLVRAAQDSAAMYNADGEVAAHFTSGAGDAAKHFMLMPWGGDKDLMVVLGDIVEGTSPKIPIVQMLNAFAKLLQRVERFHQRTGSCVGDIKPKNLMPIFNDGGELVDFMLIDRDGALIGDKFFTPEYLTEQDFKDMLRAERTKPESSFVTDFHNLAATLAQAVSIATPEGYLDFQYKSIKPVAVLADGRPAVLGRTVSMIACNPFGSTLAAQTTDNVESRAVRWMWQKLSDGVNPLAVAPTAGLSHTPLQYFLCHEQFKRLIVTDIKKLIAHFDKEVVLVRDGGVVAPDSPLNEAARKARIARITRAFNRDKTVVQQSEDALALIVTLVEIHATVPDYLNEVTALDVTHFKLVRAAVMKLIEPWQRDDPDLVRFIAENGLFANPFAITEVTAVPAVAGREDDADDQEEKRFTQGV